MPQVTLQRLPTLAALHGTAQLSSNGPIVFPLKKHKPEHAKFFALSAQIVSRLPRQQVFTWSLSITSQKSCKVVAKR